MRTMSMPLLALSAILAGCSSDKHAESAEYCESVKPGTVTSLNHYCVIAGDHPVDPKITKEWNGQSVGFCCEHCIDSWNKMTDALKADSLKVAVAKGKPNA